MEEVYRFTVDSLRSRDRWQFSSIIERQPLRKTGTLSRGFDPFTVHDARRSFRNKKLISFLFFFLLLFFFFSPSWNRSVTSASRRRTVVTRARLRLPPFDSREKVIVVRGFNEVLSNRPRLARVIISSYTAPRRIVTPTRRCWVRWVCIVSRKRGEKSCTPPPVRIRSIPAVQPPFFFPRSV